MRASLQLAGLFLLIAYLTACAPVTDFPEPDPLSIHQEAAIQKQMAHGGLSRFAQDKGGRDAGDVDTRLHDVALRVLTAASPLCGVQVQPQIAIDIMGDPTDYPKVSSVTQPPPFVLDSSAPMNDSDYDIRVGDRLLRINDVQIETGHGGYRRALDYLLELEEGGAPVTVQLLRGLGSKDTPTGQVLTRQVPIYNRCNYFVETVPRVSVPNAFADGASIRVTTSMIRAMPTNDELAFVFAHELSHNILGHADKAKIAIQLGYLVGTAEDILFGTWPNNEFGHLGTYIGSDIYSKSQEMEADYVGVYLMAAAGYDANAALLAMRRLAFLNPTQIETDGDTHPSSAVRAAAISRTIDEVKLKQYRHEILMPKLKADK